ncbi:MAG: hypothetical protein K2M17_05970, partial [Bacilli bacterium]|nr:hypothetical protein [Bacilli bacterium]
MLISNFLSSGIFSFLLFIDGIIYDFIRYAYEIFIFLAKINLFEEGDYQDIVSRIYLILGVVMLFILAYSLLKAVVNPDDFAKGDNSVPNIIKNVLISLIIITILPTVFTVAFNIQAAVLNSDIIPKVILGGKNISQEDITDKGGNTIAFNTFSAFYRPNEDFCRKELGINGNLTDEQYDECASKIGTNQGILESHFLDPDKYLSDAYNEVSNEGVSFITFAQFSDAADSKTIDYTPIISSLTGLGLFLLILSFCIDLAIRVIKLMFFQILAPIPVICRVLPGDKKKIFDSWVKETMATFLDAFIRITIMYLGVYLITLVVYKVKNGSVVGLSNLGITQRMLVVVFLIIGIVLFVKQAPKLIKDIFGIDTGKTWQSLKTLMASTAVVGGTVGAGASAMVKNFSAREKSAWKKLRNKDIKGALGSGLGGFVSAAAGGISGTVRGLYAARNAKNFSDMKKAATTGSKGATDARAKRDAYKASHQYPNIPGFAQVPVGHIVDIAKGIALWSGFSTSLKDLMDDNKVIDDITAKKKAVNQSAEDLIIGDANKGKDNTYGVTGTYTDSGVFAGQYTIYSTKTLHEIQNSLAEAKAKGSADDSTGTVRTVGEWEDLLGRYKKEFTKLVANQASLDVSSFEGLAPDIKADLAETRSKSSDLRRVLRDNLTASYVADAKITSGMLADDKALDVDSTEMKDLGNNMKIKRAENVQNINK